MRTCAGDEGQLVVFLKEDDDAVLELNADGLVRMEFVQRGDRDLLPGFGLLGGDCDGAQKSQKESSGQ